MAKNQLTYWLAETTSARSVSISFRIEKCDKSSFTGKMVKVLDKG